MTTTSKSTLSQIPAGVWVLGFVSMLMDISSEMIHSLLPLFMVTTLGASVFAVGLIEGLAESTALMVKVFSGTLSDYLGKRKGLVVFGYALGALTKPLFAIASTTGIVLTARLLDRVGKGIRGAPRDALVADIAPPHLRGAAFGLRQSLDTVGAFLGPLLAVGLMLLWANDFRAVFWVAVIPGLMAVVFSCSACVSLNATKTASGQTRFAERISSVLAHRIGRWLVSAPCSRWRDSAKRFWCCAHNRAVCRLHWCRW